MNFRQPMNPVIKNMLIMLLSGMIASVVCAKVYGATPAEGLPEKPATIAPVVVDKPVPANPVLALIGAQGPFYSNGIQVAPHSGR